MSFFRALRHHTFALLWTGQTLSRIGDFMYEIALVWWVLKKTGSPEMMSVVLVCSFTPMILLSLFGGAAVDRLHRMRVMILSDMARGVVVGLVVVLAYADKLEIGHVFIASLIFGIADAFFQPAYIAAVPALVPVEDLPSANSLTSISTNAGRIVGPPLGALVIGLGGTSLAFALDALSFFISVACLLPAVAVAKPDSDKVTSTSLLEDIREGIDVVLATPWLWISIGIFSLANVTLTGPYQIALPFLVKDYLHAGVDTLGLIYAFFPVGYILGGVWIGRQTRLRHRGVIMFGAIAMAGLSLGLFGLLPPIPVLCIAALLNGFALEIAGVIWTTSMQESVPNDMLGRVASIDQLGSFGLLPVGLGMAGWATATLGAPLFFLLGGGATVALCLLSLLHPRIRGME
jgi:DHA3 family tetracycline resistance protein-like MFS transporter